MSGLPLRLGLLGVGRIGAMHAALLPGVRGARLSRLFDPDPEAAARAAPAGAIVADDEEALLTSAEVDAVVIASPTPQHARQVEAAAEAGKAIFCEKPMAMEVETTLRALRRVRDRGVPFQVGFDRRFDPAFGALAATVRAGGIGRPEAYRAFSADPALPRRAYHGASGGLFLDFMIHDLDTARFVMGEVRRLHTVGRVLTEPWIGENGDVDTAVVTLEFSSGALGVIQAAWRAAHGHDLRIEAYGSNGKVVAEDPHRTGARRYDADGVHRDHVATFVDRFRDAYRAELQAFVDAVRSCAPPTPGPVDAVRSLDLARAAREAVARGRPVDVDPELGLELATQEVSQ